MKAWWEISRGVIIWWGSILLIGVILYFIRPWLAYLWATPLSIIICYYIASFITHKLWHEDVFIYWR